MNILPSRMAAVQLPMIPVIGQLIRDHPGTISLAQGVVSYGPPPQAFASLQAFLASPQNHQYQAVEGIEPLRSAIAAKLRRENHLAIGEDSAIVVTAGSNMGFMNAVLAITNPGDEIIISSPYYFNHEMAIRMADCQPVTVPTDTNYQLQPEAIAQAITEKTKAIVTISPNNPTGAIYPEAALRRINRLCQEKQIYHISDETYEYFTYNGLQHVSPGSFANSAKFTISLFSLSKAYGFASWRIGYMVIPRSLLEAVRKIQDTILICPPVISQYAALGALEAGYAYCQEHLQEIVQVRQLVQKSLDSIRTFCHVAPAQGAFYYFLKLMTELEAFSLAKRLIKDYGVAVIPGTTFGAGGGCYLRLSYGALSQDTAQIGMERLVAGLQKSINY